MMALDVIVTVTNTGRDGLDGSAMMAIARMAAAGWWFALGGWWW